jgi:uncharacterized protein YqeY
MELLARLQEEMKSAMKSGAKDRLGTIRMLINEVKNIDLQPNKPTPEQAVEAYAKKLRKSVEEFEKLNKPDEVTKLRAEIGIAEEFLPKKLSKEETEALVDAFLAAGAFTEKDIGKATGLFTKAHAGKVDSSMVNQILRAKLAGK